MKYDSKKNLFAVSRSASAFTLVEVMAAILILALITSNVVMVMNRCISAAIDSRKKMIAFELARENMEILLAGTSVKEKTEFGVSERDPDIEWETVVEVTSVSGSSQSILQAICSATYIDAEGESQKIEFTHWITKLTDKQMGQVRNRDKRQLDQLDRIEYKEFLQYLRQKILGYFETSDFDASEYKDLLRELNDEKSEFIENTKRFDDKKYDEFIEDQTEQETEFLVPNYFTDEDYEAFWEETMEEFDAKRSGQSDDSSSTDKNNQDGDSDFDPDNLPDGLPDEILNML